MPVISKITGAPFRFWCQKILPAVYDDSLSYYELLCKVVDYLNKVMEDDINVVNLVNELEDFVNNYFDNLDVQEEINNKLDTMAEDGSLLAVVAPHLDEIIAQYEATLDADLAEYKDTIDDDITQFKENVNDKLNAQDTDIKTFKSDINAQVTAQNTEIATFKSTVNETMSEQDNDISVMQSQMSNFIDSHSDIQTFTTLFESTEQNGGHYEGQSIALTHPYTDYTELDIYWSYLGDVRVTRVASADVLANGVVISWFADSPALQPSNPAPLNIPLMSLINGNNDHTALTISTAYAETWTGLSADSAVRNSATTSTDYDAGSIIRIIGVEYQASAELTDIRVGADGTVYPTAGDAVRAQHNDLKDTFDDIWTNSKNLFNKDDVVDGKYISTTTGSEVALATSSASNFIEIEPNTTYIISCSVLNQIRYAIYDHSKVYITGAESSASFTTPINAKYIRFSVPTLALDTAQLEEGNTATTYEQYYHVIASQYTWSKELEEHVEEFTTPLAGQIDALKVGNDLLSLEYNKGFIGGTGTITVPTANKEVYTDKVEVNEGDVINISLQYDIARAMWLAYATYDANDVFISRVALINESASSYEGTITIGAGIKYIVFTFRSYGVATFSAYRTAYFYKTLDTRLSTVEDKIGTYQPKTSVTVKSIAHRGDDIDAPQCTAPSYIIARQRGFEIAENDLWYSEDGYYVMEHDTTLTRLGDMVDINGYLMYTDGETYYWVHPTTNSVYTWDGTTYVASSVSLGTLTRCNGSNYGVNSTYANIGLNFDILRRIDFGVYKGDKFRGTQIMTFEEWVLLCKQLGMEIYIDRKWNYTNEQIAELAGIVKKYGMGNKASWLGMDGAKIIALRNIIPDSRCCLLQHPSQALIDAYTPYNVGRGFFFNGNGKTMTEEEIQLGLNAGFDVEIWFVDYGTMTEEQVLNTIRTAVSYGVTGLTLDRYRVEDAYAYLLEQY